MTFKEYIPLAVKTCKELSNEKHFVHMSAGVTTELGELVDIWKKKIAYGKSIDWINVKEEIGDTFWYIACWYDKYMSIINTPLSVEPLPGFSVVAVHLKDETEECVYLQHILKEFLDATDRYKNLGTSLEVERKAYSKLLMQLGHFANFFKLNQEDIADTNIAKLKARYPEKFTSEKALNRDLDAERRILEQ